jgi:hypothetical protein
VRSVTNAAAEDQTERIRTTVSDIVDDLEAHTDSPKAPDDKAESGDSLKNTASPVLEASPSAEPVLSGSVLCLPGLGELDKAVALPLAQLLRRRGISAEAMETDTVAMSKLFSPNTEKFALICLCYLEHATPAQLNYAARRFRRRASEVAILISIFNDSPDERSNVTLQLPAGVDLIQGSLDHVLDKIANTVAQAPPLVPPGRAPLDPRQLTLVDQNKA